MRGIASSLEYGRSWTCAAAAVNFLPCFAMCLLVVLADACASSHVEKSFRLLALGFRKPEAQRREPRACYPITSMPIDLAVPRTVFTAAARSVQLRSGIFCLAMSSTCLAVTVPTLLRLGSADPLARLAIFFSSTDAGGVLVMKV